MGTENYQYLIRQTDRTGIESQIKLEIRKNLSDLKEKYWRKTKGAEWLARSSYVTEFKRSSKI